jgi:hypothetical protein
VFPIVLAAFGLFAGSDPALRLALVWLAHIGIDRTVGSGLKYGGEFENHFARV